MKIQKNSRSRGVTLIELSIVLAILGVLIVATISGKSLIDISRATATMQQVRDRTLAFQIFSSTYDCTPGDCKASTVITGALDGNGNGKIGTFIDAANPGEIAIVENHLEKSKLFNRPVAVAGVTLDNLLLILPKSKVAAGYISTVHMGNQPYSMIGGIATATDLMNSTVIVPGVFQIIDSKLDDGVANLGSIQCHTVAPAIDATGLLTLATSAIDYTANCYLTLSLNY
ncbi:MAG: prepilin-type N-terminal cleavage/methylation domain-containing protein [Candidatus Deianiraeaceae bacterium]|jgi:prepilin-type N-terminal cleavage/methylation domain-containing protein